MKFFSTHVGRTGMASVTGPQVVKFVDDATGTFMPRCLKSDVVLLV